MDNLDKYKRFGFEVQKHTKMHYVGTLVFGDIINIKKK